MGALLGLPSITNLGFTYKVCQILLNVVLDIVILPLIVPLVVDFPVKKYII